MAVAIARPAAATTVGRPRRSAARVEHVVVDERGRVDQLDRDRRAHAAPARGRAGPGGHEHEQRPQPLAAGGDRRAGVLAEHRRRARPRARASRASSALHQLGTCAPPASTTAATASALAISPPPSRECSAMIPPAVRIQRTSAQPGGGHQPPSALRARGSA